MPDVKERLPEDKRILIAARKPVLRLTGPYLTVTYNALFERLGHLAAPR